MSEKIGCLSAIITLLFITTVFIVFTSFIAKAECYSKAKALDYKAEYGLLQGCVLEKPNGKKVLLEQLRDFDND